MYSRQHKYAIEDLIRDLSIIDEDRSRIEWIMREGILYRDESHEAPMCDLLLGYSDKEGVAVEMKRSRRRREKGIQQLENGFYVLDKMGYGPIRQKLVYYGSGGLEYELIRPEDKYNK